MALVLPVLLLRSRRRRRGRAATGADVAAAALARGTFELYDSRPHRLDPHDAGRDWGQ